MFDGDNVKPYVRKWSTDREATNFVGFIDTWGWYSASKSWLTFYSYPLSLKRGLFGEHIGDYASGWSCSGERYENVTFRPVIWNQKGL